ncbi:MAG: glycosyltransferase family 4 protein [Patescibacteria group bacterium]
MEKKSIYLFQPYLRKHILDFQKALPHFEFRVKSKKFSQTRSFYKVSMSTPEKEFSRSKITWKNKLRRIFGILNVRVHMSAKNDALFTYGCLLITNKPYCTYIENGAALFNYDVAILRNPLAQLWFSLLIRLPQCKKLIFMSKTAKQSMLATGKFSPRVREIIEAKSVQIYPFVEQARDTTPKKFQDSLRLLFTGIYYVKGGREVVNAFEILQKKGVDVSLTIVTPLHMLLPEDRTRIESIPHIQLLDATLSSEEMMVLYKKYDVFLFPTFRDTFGLVLIEAIASGMALIGTEQYATQEMIIDNFNGFLYQYHPLMDYDPQTKEMYGKLYDAKVLYQRLFEAEKNGEMKPLEEFLVHSILQFFENTELLEKFSKNSLTLYQEKFSSQKVSAQIESIFAEALH